MTLCIVPMKPLARAKERLAPRLSPGERRRLSLAMLADVIDAAKVLDVVWVLNSDPDAAELARAAGAEARPDATPDGGLNASLEAATADALAGGMRGALVLSADLPAVTRADVEALVGIASVALAPDRRGTGTNALWRSPPDAIPVAFGPGSRAAHEAAAAARNLSFATVDRARLALDVDSPDDLADAWDLSGPATKALLVELGYPQRGRR